MAGEAEEKGVLAHLLLAGCVTLDSHSLSLGISLASPSQQLALGVVGQGKEPLPGWATQLESSKM